MSGDSKYFYRGYEIVPQRRWSSWCVGVHPSRADLPILGRSTVAVAAQQQDDVVAEAKRMVDGALARLYSTDA